MPSACLLWMNLYSVCVTKERSCRTISAMSVPISPQIPPIYKTRTARRMPRRSKKEISVDKGQFARPRKICNTAHPNAERTVRRSDTEYVRRDRRAFGHLQLTFHIYGCFNHFIADGYDFSIRLKPTLSYDHLRKFICNIHV